MAGPTHKTPKKLSNHFFNCHILLICFLFVAAFVLQLIKVQSNQDLKRLSLKPQTQKGLQENTKGVVGAHRMGCRRSWQGGERVARLNKALTALGCCRGLNGQRYVIQVLWTSRDQNSYNTRQHNYSQSGSERSIDQLQLIGVDGSCKAMSPKQGVRHGSQGCLSGHFVDPEVCGGREATLRGNNHVTLNNSAWEHNGNRQRY